MRAIRGLTVIFVSSILIHVKSVCGGLSSTGKVMGYAESKIDFRSHNVGFLLFSRSNSTKDGVVVSRKHPLKSGFNPNKKTIVLVHGTAGFAKSAAMLQLKDALLEHHNLNVIIYDWSAYAQKSFKVIIKYYKAAGQSLGDFLNDLHNITGHSYDKIHIIGHSVGVHVGAFAARRTPKKIHRLTGLDPSFLRHVMENRIDFIMPTDAEHVDCMRTSIYLGLRDPVCHCDFYANDGISQKGCSSGLCDHFAATRYYANSLINPRKYPARRCTKVAEKTIEGCSTNYSAYAGYLGGTPCERGVYQFNAVLSKDDAQLISLDQREVGKVILEQRLYSEKFQFKNLKNNDHNKTVLGTMVDAFKNIFTEVAAKLGLITHSSNTLEKLIASLHGKNVTDIFANIDNSTLLRIAEDGYKGDSSSVDKDIAVAFGHPAAF